MEMKKHIHLLVAASALVVAGLAASCNKGDDAVREGAPVVDPANQAILNVRVTGSVASTKAETTVSEQDEAKVNKIEVLVFNDNGGLDAYKSSDGTGLKVEGVSSSTGSKIIVAVVNAPDGAGINEVQSLDELRAKHSSFIDDNAADNFVMYGEETKTLVASATNDVTVTVNRLAARLRVDKITRAFLSTMPGLVNLPASGFEITRVYLTNVAGDVNYGSSISPEANTTWVTDESPLKATPAQGVAINKGALVYEAANSASGVNQLAQNGSYVNTHRLYAYPNASDEQITKLVVEVKIADHYYTFPIAFENIKSNYSYEIRNITITRLGNPSNGDDTIDPNEPTDPIVAVDFDADIAVNPWNLVLMGEEGDGNIVI